MLSPGVVLSERYRLDEPLATGGMGEVWRATDLVLRRTVAVKVLLPALLGDPGFNARFQAEARMMAGLRHRGIVDVYDYGESELTGGGTVVYLVMECVDGEPLSHRLNAGGRLSVVDSLSIVAQAAEALHAAHLNGIVHRDVKPANLLIETDGTVRLVDFGIARSAAVTSATAPNSVVGTALYIAPEQAAGRPVSATTDVYALGAVAYHCLAGHPPFTGDSPIEVALRHVQDEPPPLPADVPPSVQALVGRAMEKDPDTRFPTAAEFSAAARVADEPLAGDEDPLATALLAPVAGGTAPIRTAGPASAATTEIVSPVPAWVVSSAEAPPPGPGTRRPWALAAAAAMLFALAALALWLGLSGTEPSAPADRPAPGVTPTGSTTRQQIEPGPAGGPGRSGGSVSSTPTRTATPQPAGSLPVGSAPPTPTTEPTPTAEPTEEPPPTTDPPSPPATESASPQTTLQPGAGVSVPPG